MKEQTASTVGFLVAPILPALVLGALTPVTTRHAVDLISAIVFFPITYAASATFTVLFGVPLFHLGRRLRLIRWWSTAVVGLVIGAAVTFIVAYPAPIEISSVLIYALLGAGSGLIFWAIWDQGRLSPES